LYNIIDYRPAPASSRTLGTAIVAVFGYLFPFGNFVADRQLRRLNIPDQER